MSTNDFDSESFEETQIDMSQAAPKPFWMQYAGWLLLGLIFLVYMVIAPAISMAIEWMTPPRSRQLTDMTFAESMRLYTVSGVIMFMFLSMGASVGSFLNVYVYRLPRRLPLLWPPSACTRCKKRLSLRDNIPIAGWLRLGGKCGHCGVSISARYPIVEAVAALLVITLYYRELLSGGLNLPVRQTPFYTGVVWILLYTKWDLLSIYLFHCFVMMLLLGWGLINFDRYRVPLTNGILFCVLAIGLTSAFPVLNPINKSWIATIQFMPASVFVSCLGCLVGAILGLIIDLLIPLGEIEDAEIEEPPASTGHPDASSDELADQVANEGEVEATDLAATNPESTDEVGAVEESSDVSGSFRDGDLDAAGLAEKSHVGLGDAMEAHASESPYQLLPGANLSDVESGNDEIRFAESNASGVSQGDAYGRAAEVPAKVGNAAFCLALVGATFGFEAVLFTCVGSLLLYGLAAIARWQFKRSWLARVTPALTIFAAAAIVLLFWDAAHDLIWKTLKP